ncbi:MAG: histidine kinase, partial [Bacteroidetes bacterium]
MTFTPNTSTQKETLLVVFCLFFFHSFAQNTTIADVNKLLQAADNKQYNQSTQKKLESAVDLSKKINYTYGVAAAYEQLAELHYANGNLVQAKAADSVALPLIQKLGDTVLLASLINRRGIYEMQAGKYTEAEGSFNKALQLSLGKVSPLKTGETYSNLGSLHLALGNKDKAIEHFFEAVRFFEKGNELPGMAETFSNISSVYYLSRKLPEAIEYQKKSIGIRQQIDDKKGMANSNNNIGQLYLMTGNNELALLHLEKSLKYAEALQNPKLMATAYAGLSVYNSRNKKYDEALKWQAKAIDLFVVLDDKPMLSRLYVAAGGLANAISDSTTTLNYYLKGLQLSKELSNKENIANAYEKLALFYTNRSDLNTAFEYNKSYYAYRDSINESSNIAKIAEIEAKYETEKKDKEISYLNIQQKIKQLQIEKQAAELAGNALEAEKKKNEIELLSKTTQIQDLRIIQQDEVLEKQLLLAKNRDQQLLLAQSQQMLKDKQLTTQKNIRNLLLMGLGMVCLIAFLVVNRFKLKKKIQQQNEMLTIRNDISQNLHDEIGSTLTSINILSQVSQQAMAQQPQQAKDMLKQIADQSKSIQQNMSDIVWSIRPDNEKVENLITRMREFAIQTLEPLNISFSLKDTNKADNLVLPMQHRKEILLIYKEAITNIVKHAGATQVNVQILYSLNSLTLTIADNGIWKGQSSGLGTKSMNNRATSLGGSLQILP